MAIKLPVLLDGTLLKGPPLHPISVSATINLAPLSTATIVLPQDGEEVGVRQYIQLFGPDGSLGVYRVVNVQTIYGKQREVSLEHSICTLDDSVTPAKTEYKGTFRSILQKILNEQDKKLWSLGTVAVPNSEDYTLSCGEMKLLEALLDAMELADGYALSFDQSVTPWKINVVKLPNEASCECRMSRNADYVSISRDDAELITRVYSDKLENGKMDGPTVGTWGVIARHLDIPRGMTQSQARRYAQQYLNIHKNPFVSVDIDAANLAALTGDSFDRFALGALCSVALPQWGVTMSERVVTMHYPDLMAQPDVVMLTLSTLPRSLAKTLAGVSNTAGGAGRAAKEAQEEILLQAEHIDLLAAKYVEAEDRLTAAEIILNGDDATIGLVAQVVENKQQISAAYIKIDGLESEIELKADIILLDGYVKMTTFNAELADIDKLLTGAAVIQFAKFDAIQIDNTYINSIVWKTITVNGTSYSVLAAG